MDYDKEAWAKVEEEGLGGFTGVVPEVVRVANGVDGGGGGGRSGPETAGEGGWYAVDVGYGGKELRQWAGVQYESKGGQEVGNMVKALWPEQGWETIWFVNPARLQSVPSFSHFHGAWASGFADVSVCAQKDSSRDRCERGSIRHESRANNITVTQDLCIRLDDNFSSLSALML